MYILKVFKGINTIFKALKKSLPIIRDIVLFFIFVFIFAGILGVHILGGKLKNRCVNEYGVILDEEQICSDSTARGYQCPEGFSCIKTKNNPSYNTIGFDNIFQSCLTIFQVRYIYSKKKKEIKLIKNKKNIKKKKKK